MRVLNKNTRPSVENIEKFSNNRDLINEMFVERRNKYIESAREWIDEEANNINLTGDALDVLDEFVFALSFYRQGEVGRKFLTDYCIMMKSIPIAEHVPKSPDEATTFFNRMYLLLDLTHDDEVLKRFNIDKQDILDYADELQPRINDIFEHLDNYPKYYTADTYIGYCAKKLFIELAKQKHSGNINLQSQEQVRWVYDLYSLFEYAPYDLGEGFDKGIEKTLQQFRNRSVPQKYKKNQT